MKYVGRILVSSLVATAAFAEHPKAQFISAVQMAVQEPSPQLIERSRQLVVEQFGQRFGMEPELRGRRFEIRTSGNEVLFILNTEDDMRAPVQQVVAQMIQQLNGRVHTRGRSAFYKTALTEPLGGYLEVSVDETHSKVLSIAAQSVPLRDLLKEIKAQVGSFSYLIPGECADKSVDWSFGGPDRTEGIPLEVALTELGGLFGLRVEKRNNTFIFKGECAERAYKQGVNTAAAKALRNSFLPAPGGPIPVSHTQVFVPMFPIGE
jgi:hypothetical protein